LIFEDESGFSLVSPLKRTWAPRGQTPVIRTSLNHHERLNLLGALSVTPSGRKLKLKVHTYRHTLTGDEVIVFLKDLLRQVKGAIVLVWDNHPIHQRRKVQAFLAQHPRLQVYNFPTCAPELNPVEWVWNQVCEYTANTAPRSAIELRNNVYAGIARTRNSRTRLRACLLASDLSWKSNELGHYLFKTQ
jgi:putative transposase